MLGLLNGEKTEDVLPIMASIAKQRSGQPLNFVWVDAIVHRCETRLVTYMHACVFCISLEGRQLKGQPLHFVGIHSIVHECVQFIRDPLWN